MQNKVILGERKETISSSLNDLVHLSIEGATGTGKSVFTKGVILGIAENFSKEDVSVYLCDHSELEFDCFKELPHLGAPIAKSEAEVNELIDYIFTALNLRYNLLEDMGVNHFNDYNDRVNDIQRLDHKILVLDGDFDAHCFTEETKAKYGNIVRLGRAVGIHVIQSQFSRKNSYLSNEIHNNLRTKVYLGGPTVDSPVARNLKRGEFATIDTWGTNAIVYGTFPYISDEEIKARVARLS